MVSAPLVAQLVKNVPAMWNPGFDPWVGKIPGEGEIPTHSNILAWRIPWTVQTMGLKRVGHD